MCGIAGLVEPAVSAIEIRARLTRMTDVITHRGPDDAGHYCDTGVGIGMRRLSIIDVAGGHQPIANETGEIHVVCNGEIYNFAELRRDLLRAGTGPVRDTDNLETGVQIGGEMSVLHDATGTDDGDRSRTDGEFGLIANSHTCAGVGGRIGDLPQQPGGVQVSRGGLRHGSR